MFLVEDNKRPSYLVAIPANQGDLAYDNMMDIINKFGYNIIPNPHVNTSELNKIKSKIHSFQMLSVNEIEILLSSMEIELTADRFKLYYRYEMMSKAQLRLILKIIPIDQKQNVISKVLNTGIDMMMSAKNHSGEKFKLDIDARIKLAVIYNKFQQRYSYLYGILHRNQLIFQHAILIFDTYLNYNGEDVYYLAFTCDLQKKIFEKYEQTDSIVVGGEVTKKGQWNEEILTYEVKRMEFDLIQILKCYEKTYGKFFTDSGNEWRELDKARKLQIDSEKEIRKLIKVQKDENRKQKDKEELI
jgi:hypothetical protein